MKFLDILLAFLSTQGKSFLQGETHNMTQQIVNNARRVTRLLTGLILSIVLFSIGFSMAYSSAVSAFAETGGWAWTPGVVAGISLGLAALCGLFYTLGEKRWLDATG